MNEEVADDSCTTIAELRRQVIAFRDARDWKQFHNPKDLAIAMSIEAAEVLELCRFKSSEEIIDSVKSGKNREFAYEMADVLSYLLTLSDCLGIDLSQAMHDKAKVNEAHYPVHLAKGKKAKYTEFI
ncbi:MAG: nucleotide pyrophosphohydrolase [Candidatus Bruticola sp.]